MDKVGVLHADLQGERLMRAIHVEAKIRQSPQPTTIQ